MSDRKAVRTWSWGRWAGAMCCWLRLEGGSSFSQLH